jgi:serine/threonine protein kinase/TolB-like protein
LIGQTISRYHILQKLGGGGMGVVYEAEDTRLGRRVALKFLPKNLSEHSSALERFQREARATSLLNDPSICTIFDIQEHQGQPYIVMELLEGQSLRERIGGHPMPLPEILDIGIQIAEALGAAHAEGIVHRDIKPANIFLTKRGQAKVLDFGVAKLAPSCRLARYESGSPLDERMAMVAIDPKDEDSAATATGIIPGTSFYMSPEQVRGEELDARSDLFSLGVVLYEAATGRKPFFGRRYTETMAAILDEKPLSPRVLNPELPPAFEAVLGKALEKNPDKRYQSAADLRADLEALKSEIASEPVARQVRAPAPKVFSQTQSKQRWLQLWIAGVLVTVALVLTLWWAKRARISSAAVPANTVAVLPFHNLDTDKADDFLRFALGDEISNILTYTPSLTVRPVDSAKYAASETDPQRAGRELRVAHIITGHFTQRDKNLVVTLEAIDVQHDRVTWQGTFSVPAHDSIAMQKQLAGEVRQGLLPALGATASTTAILPRNAEAYDLYLRSAAVPHDPAPNKEAISMLERSVGLDPGYPPAWDELGVRYYFDSQYGGGGEDVFKRAVAAFTRAVALDPNYVTAVGNLVRARVELGDLNGAYADAEALVQRRPDNAQAHFTLAYVQRFAGLLDEATRQCDVALGLDPGNYFFRSCAFGFMEMGATRRARHYVDLDGNSQWAANVLPMVLLRDGTIDEARQAARRMSDDSTWFGGLLQTCLTPDSGAELDRRAQQQAPAMLALRNPEFRYLQGTIMAFCGEREIAAELLKSAITQNYCATAALDRDPLLAKLRFYPDFESLRMASRECQKKFLAARGQR